MFVFIGYFNTTIHLPENKKNHYINLLSDGSSRETLLVAQVNEKLKPTFSMEKYVVTARSLGGKEAEGKVLLNLISEDSTATFSPGDIIILPADFSEIKPPLNPFQFDYSKYLGNLEISRQITVQQKEVKLKEKQKGGLREIAGNFREKIIFELRKYNFDPEEFAIIQALLLGQRQDVSKQLYDRYAAAGVIHILAVSGLHVGIILLLLNRLLRPVESLPNGKHLKTLLLLSLLWGFAFLAGLSPSVVRAVCMFSFIAIGTQLNRKSTTINSVFASLLFLLLINPYFIFQVGFQLSYAAVLSIVLIQPRLAELFEPQHWLPKFFWGIFTVTLAAQIGVLPLSLFYFHQFPGLFFLSNLVILPFLGVILGIGILLMILAVLDLLPAFLARSYEKLISYLNDFVEYISTIEEFIFDDVFFPESLMIAGYLLAAAVVLLLKKFNFRNICFFLTGIICFQIIYIVEKASAYKSETIIFHRSRNTLIGLKTENTMKLFHNLDTSASTLPLIKDYSTGRNLSFIEEVPIQNFYNVGQRKILQIDSAGIYDLSGLHTEIVLLSGSPKINLQRMIQRLQPKIIVADGSNYPSFIRQWKATSIQKNIPFHATGEKGAFIIDP